MGKRVICLICVAVLVVISFFGIRTVAEAMIAPEPVLRLDSGLYLSKGIVKHSPNPLASAMFLILAGIGISMLFDKKNRH